MKTALITGISGQDGSYLAEHLLRLGYRVYGLLWREPDPLRWLEGVRDRIEFVDGDLRNAESLEAAFSKAWPDEIYNLAAQVFVPASWECPAETFDINVGGLARLIRIVERQKPDTRIYQASSSVMFGNVDGLCNEQTPFTATSPYATSKMAAHQLAGVYRGRGLYVVSGILFNHESPRRGPEMVTRKISMAAARWALGDHTPVKLGNIEARRDWGFAGDYVVAMHAMLEQAAPMDYIIGTGVSHSVADFVAHALAEVFGWDPAGARERIGKYVETDPGLLRTGEIFDLRGDATRARAKLGWRPVVEFPELVRMMVRADIATLERAAGPA
jgi:GDPmannose 4,6-dehydratase